MSFRHLSNPVLKPYPILLLILGLAFIELIISAWLSDDALITVRSVLNMISGYGPSFNLDERVQSFTHPLWFLLTCVMTLVTKNPISSLQILSIGFSFATLVTFSFKIAKTRFGLYIGLSILMFSKAYVDFSSSGLENPLSHLLLVLILISGIKARSNGSTKSLLIFFILCSLLSINRLDLILIVLPLTVFIIWPYRKNLRQFFPCALIGAVPFIAWTSFSSFYFGFPFPNTAYAKLGNIPFGGKWAILQQGFDYFYVLAFWDPLTLFAITLGFFYGLRGTSWMKAISVGIALYLIYIIYIGGDFMAGRFFTAPLLFSVCIIANYDFSQKGKKFIAGLFICFVVSNIYLNYWSFLGIFHPNKSSHRVMDERTYYNGNLAELGYLLQKPVWSIAAPSSLIIDCGGLGRLSIFLGPSVHISDQCALADPLLARLPIIPLGGFRIGHLTRKIPLGYEETLQSNDNGLTNSKLKEYYDSLWLIVRGPLVSWDRAKAIAALNLGLLQRPDLTYLYDSAMPTPKLNERIALNTPLGHPYLPPTEFGWSYPNQQGIWANNFRSMALLPLPEKNSQSLELSAGAWIHPQHPKQDVKVFLNGDLIGQFSLTLETGNQIKIGLPSSVMKKKIITLEFEFLNAKRPKDLGVGNERRIMGMAWESFEYR